MDNLRIYFVTYNVGSSGPDQNLHEMLSLTNQDVKNLPDFYALAFQETKSPPPNSKSDDPWTYRCKENLKSEGYVKLKTVRLQGLLLDVYSLRKHLLNVREVEATYTRTGFSGMWGNKGAVTIRMSIYGCSVCFVNSHLPAHDTEYKERVRDFNIIIKDQVFCVPQTPWILYHDYVFWMGDLNFRLYYEYGRNFKELEEMINNNDLKTIFEYDQLRLAMREGDAFSEFIEKDMDFPPTFKFEVGSNTYDLKRKPAWCDRILYHVNSNNHENFTLEVDQLTYRSHPKYVLSDHKPVSAEFIIKVFSDYSEKVINFYDIRQWEEGEDRKAYYNVTKFISPAKEDWIGLFREDFYSLDDYVTYEYVSKCATLLSDITRPPSLDRPHRYEVSFPELPNGCKGNYRLVYFSQTEDKVVSVLGISGPFSIVRSDSD